MDSNFERHLIDQRMATSLITSPSYIALLIRLLTRIIPDPLVANKQTPNRLTQEDTKPNIRRASGQTLRGHDLQEGETREPPPPTLSDALFHGSSSYPRERLKPSGLESGSLLGRYLHPPVRSVTSPPSRILDGYSLELDGRCRREVRRKWLNHPHQIQLPHHRAE